VHLLIKGDTLIVHYLGGRLEFQVIDPSPTAGDAVVVVSQKYNIEYLQLN
jgi:hypothetical protein